MMLVVLIISLFTSFGLGAQVLEADRSSYQEISNFLSNTQISLSSLEHNSCHENTQSQNIQNFNTPLCSFEDICENLDRSDGYVSINGVRAPDLKYFERAQIVRRNLLGCYDKMSSDVDADYAYLFQLPQKNSRTQALLPNILGNRYNEFRAQVDENSEPDIDALSNYVLTDSDLQSFLGSGAARDIDDETYSLLERYNDFLASPSNQQNLESLLAVIDDDGLRDRLSRFYQSNLGSQRENLLNTINQTFELPGFETLAPDFVVDVNNAPIDLNQVTARANELKQRLLSTLTRRSLLPEHEEFLRTKLNQTNIVFEDNNDRGCRSGTPAYYSMFEQRFVLCPKILEFPQATIDIVLGHEISHIIDPCVCQKHAYFQRELTDDQIREYNLESTIIYNTQGEELTAPDISQLNLGNFFGCIRQNNIVPTRVLVSPEAPLTMNYNMCSNYGTGQREDQSQETYADMQAMSLLQDDFEVMTQEQAEQMVVGLALSKPFSCEDYSEFVTNPQYQALEDIQSQLVQNGCVGEFEPRVYDSGGSHLSMRDRVDHIFMNKTIQDKLGCFSIDENGETNYANETIECDI